MTGACLTDWTVTLWHPILPCQEDGKTEAKLLLLHGGLLAFGTEFLALLAVQPLGVRLLGAFERFGGAGLGGLCRGRCRIRLGCGCRGGLGQSRAGEQDERCKNGCDRTGRDRHE